MHLAIVVVVALAACNACGEHGPVNGPGGPRRDQLRIVSYNVNFGRAGDPTNVRAVGPLNGDMVFLQETNAVWEQAFVEALGRRYPHHRFTHPKAGEGPAGGMGVLSRFPIESITELPTRGGFFFAWRVVVTSNLGRIQVLNVHLRPPMSDAGSWVVGYFSTRGNRLEEIEHHLAALDPKLPTLLVGDFNEETDGLAMERLAQLGYGNATAQFNPKTPTWQWPLSSSVTLRFQLDHILHDAHFVPVASQIVPVGNSDHVPIWTDFERIDP
ncbi:MAG: endonuclease/exonuclease/phosphatase family protein [Kofleriaceae bacterium]